YNISSSRSAVKGKGKAVLRPSEIQLGGFDESPLWNHVKITDSYSKVKDHLLAIPLYGVTACKSLSVEIMKAIRKEHDDAERRKNIRILEARKQADYITLPDGSDLLQNKKHKASGPLEKAFNVVERNIADKRATRMFYASALSFNLARSSNENMGTFNFKMKSQEVTRMKRYNY
ncbi:hypothetical protein RJ639_012434, partial [Escallonia herrerae]